MVSQDEKDRIARQEAVDDYVRRTRRRRAFNTAQITFRLPPDKLAQWQAAADAAHMTLSDYIRRAVDASIS